VVQVLKIHSGFGPEAENFDSDMVLPQAVPVQSYTAWKIWRG
jgi:hypothetical protein